MPLCSALSFVTTWLLRQPKPEASRSPPVHSYNRNEHLLRTPAVQDGAVLSVHQSHEDSFSGLPHLKRSAVPVLLCSILSTASDPDRTCLWSGRFIPQRLTISTHKQVVEVAIFRPGRHHDSITYLITIETSIITPRKVQKCCYRDNILT
jgi:hypothetical protein